MLSQFHQVSFEHPWGSQSFSLHVGRQALFLHKDNRGAVLPCITVPPCGVPGMCISVSAKGFLSPGALELASLGVYAKPHSVLAPSTLTTLPLGEKMTRSRNMLNSCALVCDQMLLKVYFCLELGNNSKQNKTPLHS